jgi:hypothetical protein
MGVEMGTCNSYPHIDEFLYEICIREDILEAIAKNTDKFEKFDIILTNIRDTYQEKIQAACNEIFGEDTIFVM